MTTTTQLPAWAYNPDKHVQVNLSTLQAVNLRMVAEVDWKPNAIVLWLDDDNGFDIPDTHPQYPVIVAWFAQHGERRMSGVGV